jgi:hypothetical protein
MNTGDKVKLISFNGTLKVSKKINDSENYWKLIGEIGIIIKDPQQSTLYANFSKKPRVMVRFNKDLTKLGLISHNNVTNTLWILVSDLEKVNAK